MGNFNELIKDLQNMIFNRRHGIFIVHLPIFLDNSHDQKSIFKKIINRIIALIFDNILDGPQWPHSIRGEESFILLNSRVNELSDDVAE